tara:strand:- start:36 stop:368 length:333 start_codon:yes stop_codon:yes gene_type:complete
MAKFISINITANASQYKNVEHLIPVDSILNILQTADQTVTIILDSALNTTDLVTLTAQTSAGNPVSAAGAPLTAALNYAITANPGGVKARVALPLDDNSLQMSFTDIVIA